MTTFETLNGRGQLGRLRALAERALTAYGIRPARIVPLAHAENSTFRVETSGGGRFVLRIQRVTGTPFHPPRGLPEVGSELMWLSALRRETNLAVPEPMPTTGGSLLTVTASDGVPAPRICVLFRWTPGRFLDAGLTPKHLERVGGFIARLHDHAVRFAPPPGFERWQIEAISDEAGAYIADTVAELGGPRSAATVERLLALAQRSQRQLGTGSDVFGLIHSDLHQQNYLFHRGEVGAIDFDDCGWGHFVYDLAVASSELRHRRDHADLLAAMLRGYRGVRALPAEHERHIDVFVGVRALKLTLWMHEQRDHPGFADWEAEAREGLADLDAITDRLVGSG
jgi:Ser/Thr protein kinase RdoA (MazF antagonist)